MLFIMSWKLCQNLTFIKYELIQVLWGTRGLRCRHTTCNIWHFFGTVNETTVVVFISFSVNTPSVLHDDTTRHTWPLECSWITANLKNLLQRYRLYTNSTWQIRLWKTLFGPLLYTLVRARLSWIASKCIYSMCWNIEPRSMYPICARLLDLVRITVIAYKQESSAQNPQECHSQLQKGAKVKNLVQKHAC